MRKKIRFGILGCADIAKRKFIPALLKSRLAEFAGIASRSKERRNDIAQRYKVKGYSYESLIRSDEIDAVYIPLPNYLHFEWCIKALEENKHVLCEKPIVLDLDSAYRLTRLAKRHNRLLMEGFMFLYHKQHHKIKEIIERKMIGEPVLFRSSFGFFWNNPDNFRMKKEMGGGVIYDTGGYPLSIIRLLFNTEVKEATGYIHYNKKGLDLSFTATAKLENSMLAQLHGSFIQQYECFYQIVGTKGKITLDRCYTTPADLDNFIYLKKGYDDKRIKISAQDHFKNMIDYFCNNINSNQVKERLRKEIVLQAKAMQLIRGSLNPIRKDK